MGIYYTTQGTQSSMTRRVGYREKWEGGPGGRGHLCTYGWFFMYDRKPQNSVKQLSFN